MKSEDFNFVRDLLAERSGLVIAPEKVYLLESRLTPLACEQGLNTMEDLIREIRSGRDEALIAQVTEAMTTNESFFFRDNTPFQNLKDIILPQLYKSRKDRKRLRIWCAAASSGQEPYSIAMLLRENSPQWADWKIDIVATDLSRKILQKAEKGVYSQFEVQRGLPIQLMIKYFKQVGEQWQIADELRRMVTFKEHNLLHSCSGLGQFDVIFCRNVLIYFSPDTKRRVLESINKLMAEDGSLFLGSAETVLGISEDLKPVKDLRGVYQKTRFIEQEKLRATA